MTGINKTALLKVKEQLDILIENEIDLQTENLELIVLIARLHSLLQKKEYK